MSQAVSAFEGLNVLDISERLSGAFAGRFFGDFGADVLLAEPPGGHCLRHEVPFSHPAHSDDSDPSPLHAYVNWNKRSTAYAELADLQPLVAAADLVICTELATANTVSAWLRPDAVLLVLTAHGAEGSLAGLPGNNLTVSARTGWSYINRLRDEPPLQMPRYQSGYVGGIAGFIAASAALLRRSSQSNFERVDVSEVEAFAHTVHPWGIMSIYAGMDDSYGPAGWRPRGAPSPLWDTSDGRMHLAIGDFHHWTEAMDILGLPDIGRQPELIPDFGRHGQNLLPVFAAVAETLPKMDRWNVFFKLADLRCVVGVMQDTADLLVDPQYAAREYLVKTEVKDKSVKAAGAPFKLSPAPWQLRFPAPTAISASAAFNSPSRFAATQVDAPLAHSTASEVNAQKPSPSGKARVQGAGPLAGLRVLSLGQAWSGTFGSEIFSLLGADVVQLGGLQRPDVWRRVRNEVPAGVVDQNRKQHPLNTSSLYNAVNLNKREVTLNLKDPRGMAIFWQLLPKFDVLLDNFRASVMPSWGVTLEKLHELRPGMIWASISGYGSSGPFSAYPANGASTEPMSGFSSLHGYSGDPGMNTAGLFPDPLSGYMVASGIMAALHHRDKTGEPQRVDLSMMEAMTTVCGDALIEYQLFGEVPRPAGNRHPRFAPYNYFQCKNDQWLALCVETDAQWRVVADKVGGELSEPRWTSSAYRKQHEEQLEALLATWCITEDARELEASLTKVGVIAARVMPLYELYTDPQSALCESGFIKSVYHDEAGASLLPTEPWHFSGTEALTLKPSPRVGEHSREVLVEELGLSEDEYNALVEAQITGTLGYY